MKKGKNILLTVFLSCLIICVAVCATACGKKTPTANPNPAEKTYTVTYDLGSCDGASYGGTSELPTETEKKEGEEFTLAAAPVWDGYIFKGWSDGKSVYNARATFTMPKEAVTLTATWEKAPAPVVTYAVTYSLGSCDGTEYGGTSELPSATEKEEGESFVLAAAPEWNGYIFKGWSDGTQTYDADATFTMPKEAVVFTAVWAKEILAHSVTYDLGSCDGAAYGGTTHLPTTADKKASAKFRLAAAPVWSGYTFLGWHDGEKLYEASTNYTMPDRDVTLTATWANYPAGYTRDEGVEVGEWAEGAKTSNYEIAKGQYVQYNLSISSKEYGHKDYGIIGQAFSNSGYNKNGTFLQFRPDFAIDRTSWSWGEDNTGFTVTDINWDEEQYAAVTEGDLKINVSLGSDGKLTYKVEFTSESYSFTRTFVTTRTMDSALIYFGYVGCNPSAATVTYPTITQPAEPTVSSGYRVQKDVYVGVWNDGVETDGYKIEKGQHVQLSAYFNGKGTSGTEWAGIVGQVFANCDESNTGTFYYYRPDFAIKRTNWSWNQGTDSLPSQSSDWNTNSYIAVARGVVTITVSLSESGTLTYKVELTSANYSYTKTYTAAETMDSALVYFATDGCAARPAYVVLPRTTQFVFDYGYSEAENGEIYVTPETTFDFDYDPYRTGYLFLGWQANGTGTYYKHGDTYTVGDEDITFVAAWVQNANITIDKDGGKGTVNKPRSNYNQETGKFEIASLPSAVSLTKSGYAFKCWEVTVNGVITTVDGAFTVDPGTEIVFKAIWGAPLKVTYNRGECEGTSYGGSSKLPTQKDQAEGGVFVLSKALEWGGYTFVGWNDGENTYAAEANYTMPDHAVTLTAVWEKLPHYSVTYLAGSCNGVEYGGQNLIDEQEDTYEGAVFPLAREIKWAGYKFLGWSDGTTTYNALYRYTMPNHAVTFTAQWEKLPTHTVTFVSGTTDTVLNMPTATTYYEGQVLRTIPVRFGYTFKGWSDGTNIYQTGVALSLTADDITLTAQWEEETDPALVLLSGVWEYEDEDGTIYFTFSGAEAAWDAFDAFGSYIAGSLTVTSSTDTQIAFTMALTRGSSGTTKYSGIYYYNDENYGTDVIRLQYGFGYVTLHRATAKPESSGESTSSSFTVETAYMPKKEII